MLALAVASDFGTHAKPEHAQRSALLAAAIAKLIGLPPSEAKDAYFLALLRTIGCTGDDEVAFQVLGEDVGIWGGHLGGASPAEALGRLLQNVGRGEALPTRARKLLRAFAGMPQVARSSATHCELGVSLAEKLGLPSTVVAGLRQVFERWDGSGQPHHMRGDAISHAVRVAQIATDLEVAVTLGGPDDAAALLTQRAGRGYEPALARRVAAETPRLLGVLETPELTRELLAAEPGPPLWLSGEAIDRACRAMGEYADLKSRFLRGHSASVARLAEAAARALGRPEPELIALRRAAHLHDLGRVGVFLRIWDKATPLGEAEREQIRMHTYFTERCLAKLDALPDVLRFASLAHERADGSGYHRRAARADLPLAARVLAAADAFVGMTEARPHRPALSPDAAARELRSDTAAGRFDREAVDAVLSAAGQAALPLPLPLPALPAGLTAREAEVLALVARGLTNKEIAVQLDISVKTAGRHLENLFPKIGVTTRAAAALFAMQNDLLRPDVRVT